MIYALVLYFTFLIVGLSSLVVGVHILLGLGYAYLAGGTALIVLALIIGRGLKEPSQQQPKQKG